MLITKDIIEAIGYEIEPGEESMTEKQRVDFHKLISTICDKELEALRLKQKMEKIKTLEYLIALCIENDDKETKEALMEELTELL